MEKLNSDKNKEKNTIPYAFPKLDSVDPSCYIDAYNLILECSQAHTPRSFSVKLLDLRQKVCSYDKAIVFFLNANQKVSGYYSVNIDDSLINTYLEYYLNIVGDIAPNYDIYINKKENSGYNFSNIIDWSQLPPSEFKQGYIDVLGLKYSWGFCFFDLLGIYRVIVSLDRTRNVPFSKIERDRLGLALPILNNMHRNFFYQGMDTKEHVVQTPWQEYHLTTRETEVANLLCQGMNAQNISSALYIAITTTYKHISNIFQKTGVSSQQELIVKLINKKTV